MKQLDEERAKLDFGGDDEKAMPGKPVISPDTIREISARAGFRKTGVQATPKTSEGKNTHAASSSQSTKATRRKTGRGASIFNGGLIRQRTRQSTNTQTGKKSHSAKPLKERWLR